MPGAFDLGLLQGAGLRRFTLGLERWMLRRFDRVSSISMRMLEHLRAKGVAADRVVSFPNWVDVEAIRPKDTLIKSDFVFASAAKQSMAHAESMASGSPRRYAPREDEIGFY